MGLQTPPLSPAVQLLSAPLPQRRVQADQLPLQRVCWQRSSAGRWLSTLQVVKPLQAVSLIATSSNTTTVAAAGGTEGFLPLSP